MKRIALMLIVSAAAACGGGGAKDKVVAPDPNIGTPTTTTAVLTLGPASMVMQKGTEKHELAITADGTVTGDGKAIGTLTAAGEMKDSGGTVLAQIAADGTVTVPGDTKSKLAIRDDGAVVIDGATMIEIGADGALTGKMFQEAGMTGASASVTGAAETRRALMLAWVAAMASGGHEESHVEGPTPAP